MFHRHTVGRLGRWRAAIAVVLAGTQLGCLGPMRRYSPAGDYVKHAAPARVRVTLADGTTHQLSGPQVVLDSLLTGWIRDGTQFVEFPLTQVESVSARERSQGRTLLLVGTGAAALVAVVALFGGSGAGGFEPDPEGEGEP
ncbi:MAG: hypothetical protein HY560_05090 [Gemmatimonadetes bacterium]|nr:hypothetical protein [Gemmatimonadota bacterium]